MVYIDLECELKRIKREEKAAEKQNYIETEKQMRTMWDADDAADRTARALQRLKTAREIRNYSVRRNILSAKKLENVIINTIK